MKTQFIQSFGVLPATVIRDHTVLPAT